MRKASFYSKPVHPKHYGRSACVITAHNPMGIVKSAADNAKRNRKLLAEIKYLGHPFVRGVTVHPTYPIEKSFAVFGIGLILGTSLARKHKQLGFIYHRKFGVTSPVLVVVE